MITGTTGDYTIYDNLTATVYTGKPNWGWSSGPYIEHMPNVFNTRKELKDYLIGKEVTKEIFDQIDERVPFGTDTIRELNKAGIKSPYLNQLNRERKLKRLLK